jgi:hypothetical protein
VAGITLEQAQDMLDKTRASYEKALLSQEHSLTSRDGGRQNKLPLLESLLQSVQYWEKKVAQLQRQQCGGIRVRGAVPVD